MNKSGVRYPPSIFTRKRLADSDTRPRFGFVGGPGPNKGSSLFLKAFAEIARTDYELIIVDAARNHGGSCPPIARTAAIACILAAASASACIAEPKLPFLGQVNLEIPAAVFVQADGWTPRRTLVLMERRD